MSTKVQKIIIFFTGKAASMFQDKKKLLIKYAEIQMKKLWKVKDGDSAVLIDGGYVSLSSCLVSAENSKNSPLFCKM